MQSEPVLGPLILLFTAVPVLELALLIWIGKHVGIGPTILLILATGVLGASLARHQGLATWRRFHLALDRGRLPGTELVEALLILVAGAVLLTPGVLTDAAGFLILIPPVRRVVARRIKAAVKGRIVVGPTPRPSAGRDQPHRSGRPAEIIDAEFEVVQRDERDRPDRS